MRLLLILLCLSSPALAAEVKKLPPCWVSAQEQGWDGFWKYNYFTLKPPLLETKETFNTASISFTRGSSGTYSYNFNRGGGFNSEYHIHQIYSGAQKIYDGKWDITKTEKGSIQKPPALSDDDLALLGKSGVVEFKIVAKYSPTGAEKFVASARVDMRSFGELLEMSEAKRAALKADRDAGRCKDPARVFPF